MTRPTLKEHLQHQEKFYAKHVAFHPANAFCGTSGQHEMRHIQQLIDDLNDSELEELITKGGISFGGLAFDRDTYEGVVDELDREDFYRLYQQITDRRTIKPRE